MRPIIIIRVCGFGVKDVFKATTTCVPDWKCSFSGFYYNIDEFDIHKFDCGMG